MILYYTNSLKANQLQPIALRSVGGYVSSSPVPNDFLSNVFSEITQLSIQSNRSETILIALKNTTEKIADNIKIKFTLPEGVSIKLAIAATTPTVDKCGDFVFEKIANSSAKPFNATFQSVADGDIFSLGSLAAGKVLGLWFSKTIDKNATKSKTCAELDAAYLAHTQPETVETINAVISWEDESSISSSNSNSQSGL
jgi:hypothetical protein